MEFFIYNIYLSFKNWESEFKINNKRENIYYFFLILNLVPRFVQIFDYYLILEGLKKNIDFSTI